MTFLHEHAIYVPAFEKSKDLCPILYREYFLQNHIFHEHCGELVPRLRM